MTKTTITKAGRLFLLHRLRQAGVLQNQSLRDIGNALKVDPSTILRDLRALDQVEEEYQRLMATQPWIRRDLDGWSNISESAASTGYSADHLRHLARQHKINAQKVRGRWWIEQRSLKTYIAARKPGPGGPRGPRQRGGE